MWTADNLDQLQHHRFRTTGAVAFVPTMGALHDGHLSLVDTARHHADHVIVSIYLNPTQFGPAEDIDAYPRSLDADLQRCRDAHVAGVFMPNDAVMYPPDTQRCLIDVPALTHELEGAQRPGHFPGVCLVVAKLLHMVNPHVAVFGRKDYQQLKVIEAMTRDLAMPTRIVASPTIREHDGLARSSRNAYLDTEQRRHALGLHKALTDAEQRVVEQGETDPQVVEAAMQRIIEANHLSCDYAVIRHPESLANLDCIEPQLTGGVIALVAARAGKTRLLDNRLLPPRVER